MICSGKDTANIKQIKSGEQIHELVENCKYLKVVVSDKGSRGEEITERIRAGKLAV